MRLRDFPRAKRRAVESIISSMSPEDRAAWDEMTAEDDETLLLCLREEYEHDGVFNLDGIKKHFRLARILMGESS